MNPSVLEDPFVLYHGTSAASADRIRREGLSSRAGSFSKADVERVLAAFARLSWCGDDLGGWLVLSAYTLGWDFRAGMTKPVYLTECIDRARLYAQKDWAGGETARGVRHALDDLRRLATDPATHERYETRLRSRESQVIPAHREEVAAEHAALADINERARSLLGEFTHGEVVALRFDEADLQNLEYHEMHGIMSHQPIPPDQIVGVEIVSLDYRHDPFTGPDPLTLPAWSGIVTPLRARPGAR